MRRSVLPLIVLLALAVATLPGVTHGAECPAVTVCFTPGENCTQTIVEALGAAKQTIIAQAYSFTSAPIAKALLDAHQRGVQVQVILDKSQRSDKYSSADFLANQGVPVVIDANHAIAHNKIIVIDGETVLTGSFNFTKAAQTKNAENLVMIRDAALALLLRVGAAHGELVDHPPVLPHVADPQAQQLGDAEPGLDAQHEQRPVAGGVRAAEAAADQRDLRIRERPTPLHDAPPFSQCKEKLFPYIRPPRAAPEDIAPVPISTPTRIIWRRLADDEIA